MDWYFKTDQIIGYLILNELNGTDNGDLLTCKKYNFEIINIYGLGNPLPLTQIAQVIE